MCSISGLRRALDPVILAEDAGIKPDPWQRNLLRSASDRILINASRQSGKSTTCGVLAAHKAAFTPRSLVLLLSPSLRQSQELFSKTKAALPDRPQRESSLSLELVNGSRVISLPGSEKTIRGYSGAALLIVDEAARVDDGLYYAVRPMMAVACGTLILLSTPHGKRGAFFDAWNSGEEWERYEVPAEACPRISPEFLEEERRSMPERFYLQEYCCEFVETEDQVFAYEIVRGAVTPEVSPLRFEEGWA